MARVRKLAIQLLYHCAQLFVHPRSETNQIAPISWMEREKIFVRRFQVRIQTFVQLSKALGRLATFEIQFEIYESENDDPHAMSFPSSASEYAAQLATIVLPELFALVVQTPLRYNQFIRRTPPRPIDIVVPD